MNYTKQISLESKFPQIMLAYGAEGLKETEKSLERRQK